MGSTWEGPIRSLFGMVLALTAPAAFAQGDYMTELYLGVEAFYSGRLEEAIERWEHCLELRPQDAECARRLAAAHGRAGRVDEALESLGLYVGWGGAGRHLVEADPALEQVRRDPRFEELHAALLANYERASGRRRTRASLQRRALENARDRLLSSLVLWRDGHSNMLYWGQISPDGERVVTEGEDGVFLWDSWSGELLARLEGGFQGGGFRTRWSPDGETILVIDAPSCTASLWDGRSGDALWVLDDRGELVVAADFLDGSRVVTADDLGVLRTWDVATSELTAAAEADIPIRTMESRRDGSIVTLEADARCRLRDPVQGEVLCVLDPGVEVRACGSVDDGRILTIDDDGATRLWPAEGGAPLVYPGRPSDRRWGTELHRCLSPDGSRLQTLDGNGLRLWDAQSATPIATILSDTSQTRWGAWSIDGNLILPSGYYGGYVTEWSGRDGAPIGRFVTGTATTSLDAAPDGRLLLCTGHGAFVLGGGQAFVALQSHAPRLVGLAYDEGGRVFTGLDGTPAMWGGSGGSWFPSAPQTAPHSARFWDLVTGVQSGSVQASGSMAPDAVFFRDGRTLVASVQSNQCPLLGAGYEVLGSIPDSARRLALSPDERRVVLLQGPDSVNLWSIEGEHLWGASGLASPGRGAYLNIARPVFSPPDGALFVTAHDDDTVRVWNSDDGSPVAVLEGHEDNVRDMAFSPDGQTLLTCGLDGVARLWDTRWFEEIHVLETRDVWLWKGAFSPDGRLVAAAGASGSVYVWDAGSGERLHTLAAHTGPVNWLGFHPGGEWLISCGDDSLGRLWRVDDGSPGPALSGHEAPVWDAVLNEDGSRLMTRGNDAATCVWEIPSGRLLLTHVEYAEQGWLSFEPGGHYVAGGKAAEWARIRVGNDLYPLSSYASVLESPEEVRTSLAGKVVRSHTLLQAPDLSLSTAPNGTVNELSVQVEGRITSLHGVAEVTVTRGGRRPDGTEAEARPLDADLVASGLEEIDGNRDLRLALDVPIPRGWSEVLVRVRARSGRDIWSQVETVHRRYVPPVGKLRVLAIGVQDYDDDRYDLSSAAKDARDVAALFAGQTELFGEVETRVLLDSEVNQASLNEALEEFLYPAGEDDTIVVFVAGHGARSKRTGSYYFLTSEATPEKPTSGIPRDQIYKLVQWGEIRARKRLLLLDTCHAGEDYAPGERGVGVGLDEAFDQREVNTALSEGNGLYIVAASRELGVAREQEGNGVFTGVLLEGLRGAADTVRNRGTVDVEELMRYVQDTVPARTGGAQRPTVPQGLGGVPFPLARVQEASAEGGR